MVSPSNHAPNTLIFHTLRQVCPEKPRRVQGECGMSRNYQNTTLWRYILGQVGCSQALIDPVFSGALSLRGGLHIPREPSGERQILDGNSGPGKGSKGLKKQTGRLAISSGNPDGARSTPFPPVKVLDFAGRPTALGP